MISVRSLIGIGMCAMVSLVGSNTVFGQTSAPSTTERVAALETRTNALEEKNNAPGLWKTLGFQISGAAQASYTYNLNYPGTNNNQLRIFDTQANSFSADVFQLMVERPANADSALDRVGFRARVNFGAQSRFSRARTNYQPGTDNSELDLQEVYGEYLAPIGNGLKIQFGKINTLIGLEVINSWENPNFSRSFTFGLAQAFTETGVRFTYPFASWATLAVGLVNGWDNIEDNNKSKTVTWNLNLTPHEKFGFIVYGSYGSEQSNNNAIFSNAAVGGCTSVGVPAGSPGCDPQAKRLVIGSLITFKPTDKDTLILEPYYGNEENASVYSSSQNARWNALLAYFTHDVNDQTQPHALSVRVRGEIFEDAGGARSCTGGQNFNGGTNVCAQDAGGGPSPGGFGPGGNLFNFATGLGQPQTLWEGTFTLQYKPAPSLMTRTEFRYDKSNHNVFLDGGAPSNNQQTLSFSVVYLF
jgi:Putative beta-barrel porin-2, OmpL-like. bbp2